MPCFDDCHEQVVKALQKDGWLVELLPLSLKAGNRRIHINIRAKRQENGSAQVVMLAQVKCFADENTLTTDLYTAIGQYLIYRAILAELNIDYPLYLAVPVAIYKTIFDACSVGFKRIAYSSGCCKSE